MTAQFATNHTADHHAATSAVSRIDSLSARSPPSGMASSSAMSMSMSTSPCDGSVNGEIGAGSSGGTGTRGEAGRRVRDVDRRCGASCEMRWYALKESAWVHGGTPSKVTPSRQWDSWGNIPVIRLLRGQGPLVVLPHSRQQVESERSGVEVCDSMQW